MGKFFILGFALVVLASSLGCSSQEGERIQSSSRDQSTDVQSNGDFVSLFNGDDLEGWRRHMNLPVEQVGGKWEVVDGAIVGDQDPPGHGGFLVTTDKYENYVLRLETKLDYPVDSGIFLRVGEEGESHQITLDYRPEGMIGAVYMAYLKGYVQKNNAEDQFKKKEWNDIKVRIEGHPPRIQFWLNGEKVTDFQHTEETVKGAPKTGFVGLQVHPGGNYEAGKKVRFRNIQIKELSREAR